MRARLGTAARFCEVVVRKLRAVPSCADLVQLSIESCTDQVIHCRANMAHIRQSRQDFGIGFLQESLKSFKLFPLHSEAEELDHAPRGIDTAREGRFGVRELGVTRHSWGGQRYHDWGGYRARRLGVSGSSRARWKLASVCRT